MDLFIRLKNGQPFEHPIYGDNFRQAFPDVDVDNLPEWVARFERVEQPAVGVYEIHEGVVYVWDGAVVKDSHTVRPMTETEKVAKQEETKAAWVNTGLNSWVFDETTCSFNAPTPRPNDGKFYQWDEPTTSWIEIKE